MTDSLDLMGKTSNTTAGQCFNSQSTVLEGQPFGGIPTVLIINIFLWLLIIVAYSFLRKAAWDYGRLGLLIHNDSLTSLVFGDQSERSSPSDVSLDMEHKDKGFCSWIFNSLSMRNQDLINRCGEDARIYMTFQYHLIFFMLLLCIPSMGVILPINYLGPVLERKSHFGRTTIVNVSPESKFLWLHCFFSFFYFIINVLFMAHHCLSFLPRKSYKTTRTLMITHVPKTIQDPDIITRHFHEAYPGCVVNKVHFCYDVRNLIDLDDQRRHAMRGRLYYTAKAKKKGKQMIKIHPCSRLFFCKCCVCFKEVDAEQYYSELEEQLTDEFNAEFSRVRLRRLDLMFVTFQNVKMARRVRDDYKWVACRKYPQQSSMTNSIKSNKWRVNFASHPKDIIWKHLATPRFEWWARFIIINIFLFLLFFFLTTPSIIMNTIDKYNVTRPIEKLKSPVLTQFFPSVLLWAFTVILPMLVYYSAFLEAHWTNSSQNLIVMHKCYIFLVFMVLILPSMGLTSLNIFLHWLFDVYYLGQTSVKFQCVFLPDNGAFFVNYVITSALMGTAMELLRIGSLFYYCFRLIFSTSEPERVHIRKDQAMDFQYGREYAWMLNVFTVVVAYSVTCPIIVPFGLLYLFMKHITDRYNMYYSYVPTKLNEQIHRAAITQAIVAPIVGLIWMFFFSLLRLGKSHILTIMSINLLILSIIIAVSSTCMGKIRNASVAGRQASEEMETVFDLEPSSVASTPTSLLYEASVLHEPEMTPAPSPGRQSYGSMNRPHDMEEENNEISPEEIDTASFEPRLELENQKQ